MSKKFWIALAAAVFITLIAFVSTVVPQLHWRGNVVALKLRGLLPEVRWSDLAVMMRPGSEYAVERLADTANPFAVIKNPLGGKTDEIERGRAAFMKECTSCHGDSAQGGPGAPSLRATTLKHGRSDWALFQTIRNGVPGTAMTAHDHSREDLWRLVAFVQSLAPSAQEFGIRPLPVADGKGATPIPYSELAASEAAGVDWPSYSGAYSGARHSRLEQITPANVSALAPSWIHQVEGPEGMKIECTPVVRDGRMFVTLPTGSVLALDASTGHLIWRFDRRPPANTPGWGGPLNRGVAILGSHVFVGTDDAQLIALSADDGRLVWSVGVAEAQEGRHISSAPLAIDGLVVIGTTGAFGRGSVAAFDAATGAQRWRFYTVPDAADPLRETWSGESWKDGGAAAWMTGSYDPGTDILYWGVGNPSPDYNHLHRLGDNLYSNSVVALRGRTGQLLWHFQFTPGDDHDWDSAQVPMLWRSPGREVGQLLFPNRNGFYYHLDGRTGRLVSARPYAAQNWASRLSESGRPLLVEHSAQAAARGVLTYPSNIGATNWWPPSLDARRGLVFVPVLERGQVFFPGVPGHDPGTRNYPASSGQPHQTMIKALDAETGVERWRHGFPPRRDREETAGLLSTASGLVFGADQTTIVALHAEDGRELWKFHVGGQVSAAPMSYSAKGGQFVAVAAGKAFIAFGLPAERH